MENLDASLLLFPSPALVSLKLPVRVRGSNSIIALYIAKEEEEESCEALETPRHPTRLKYGYCLHALVFRIAESRIFIWRKKSGPEILTQNSFRHSVPSEKKKSGARR